MYHAGERYVQERAGQAAAARDALGAISKTIPPPAATFLAEREFIVIAAADADGRVWTSQVTGQAGFMHVDEKTLHVAARPHASDPLAVSLAGRTAAGTIAIDFATRRRMRLNGISTGTGDGFTVASDQVYANCPKFISERRIEGVVDAPAPRARDLDRLDTASRALIATADTFFIGTADGENGADASHRGGRAGFVETLDDRTLRFPDYRGNAMYMTLGNVVVSPRVGLLFIDWQHGHSVQISGTAEIQWDPALSAHRPGMQRMLTVRIERIVATTNASPLRWSAAIPSRVSPSLAP